MAINSPLEPSPVLSLSKTPSVLHARSLRVRMFCCRAQGFAQEQGIPECTFEDLLTERQFEIWKTMQAAKEIEEPRYHRREVRSLSAREEKHGTVGAVALDMSDRLAAATSTGGISNKYPGRVGDSPLVGCGFYADEQAAISCTGDGEDFVRLLIAKRAADFVARGNTAREA